MSFLTPVFAAVFALAIPIILLYMLRLRRREVVVSSTMLWERLLKDREANTPWQKLRRNLLLFIQLLILLMLTLALMRPAIPAERAAPHGAALIIDGSASMRAEDQSGGQTRFATAMDEAEALIASLPSDETMTIILATPLPQVLSPAAGDHALLRAGIAGAEPSMGEADWTAAFTLAAAGLAGDEDAEIIVISDGGLPDTLPLLPYTVRFLPVGGENENLAISAMSVRPLDGIPQLFIAVENYGEETAEAILQVDADGAIHQAERITVEAGESASMTVSDLPAEVSLLRAALLPDQGETLDVFPLDDEAFTVYAPPAEGRIALISEGNLFLEQLLNLVPGMTVTRSAPGSLPGGDFDLIILDGWMPSPLPETDMLIINPAADCELFSLGSRFTNTAIIDQLEDPILAFVDFKGVAIREAVAISDAPWSRPLVGAEGGPLLSTGESDGRKIAVIGFALKDSDLPLRIEFPILIANLLDWYAPAALIESGESPLPGDPVTIRLNPLTTQVRVTKPDGGVLRIPVSGDGAITTNDTVLKGIYGVELLEGLEVTDTAAFAINTYSRAESTIAPKDTIIIGEAAIETGTAEAEAGYIELWSVFAALALALLALEWWVYQRR